MIDVDELSKFLICVPGIPPNVDEDSCRTTVPLDAQIGVYLGNTGKIVSVFPYRGVSKYSLIYKSCSHSYDFHMFPYSLEGSLNEDTQIQKLLKIDRLESFGSYITNPYHLMTHPETWPICVVYPCTNISTEENRESSYEKHRNLQFPKCAPSLETFELNIFVPISCNDSKVL